MMLSQETEGEVKFVCVCAFYVRLSHDKGFLVLFK